jgi:3'(2'), 5'-bisphosphate nucleotidase
MNDQTQKFVDDLKETSQKEVEIVSRGSSLKFCLVASGQAQMYPRFAPTMEWDTAAGQAICEAVGLKVIDRTTNDSLLYNREDLLNPHFLVTS